MRELRCSPEAHWPAPPPHLQAAGPEQQQRQSLLCPQRRMVTQDMETGTMKCHLRPSGWHDGKGLVAGSIGAAVGPWRCHSPGWEGSTQPPGKSL